MSEPWSDPTAEQHNVTPPMAEPTMAYPPPAPVAPQWAPPAAAWAPPPAWAAPAPPPRRRVWPYVVLAVVLVLVVCGGGGAVALFAVRSGSDTTQTSAPVPSATDQPVDDPTDDPTPAEPTPTQTKPSPYVLPTKLDGMPKAPGNLQETMSTLMASFFDTSDVLSGTPSVGVYQVGNKIAVLVGLPNAYGADVIVDDMWDQLTDAGYTVSGHATYPSPTAGGAMQCARAVNDGVVFGVCLLGDNAGLTMLMETGVSATHAASVMKAVAPKFER